jgi:hypothetical protein
MYKLILEAKRKTWPQLVLVHETRYEKFKA